MIVSHLHKFIFVAIPKTATHAIRQALRPHLHEHDWEQVEHLRSSRIPLEYFKRISHGHQSLSDIKPYLPEDSYRKYFKFGFVRNPYERFISYAFFRFKGNRIFLKSPTESMKLILKNGNHKHDLLLKPQYDFLCNDEDRVDADFIGRFEDIQDNFDEIMLALNLPSSRLNRVNPSTHDSANHYLDQELARMIESKYRSDFEEFYHRKSKILR